MISGPAIWELTVKELPNSQCYSPLSVNVSVSQPLSAPPLPRPPPAHPLATSGSWFHPPSPLDVVRFFFHFRNSEIPFATMKSYLYVKTCTFQQKWTKKKLYLFVNFDVKSCFLLQSVFPYLCVCAPKIPPPSPPAPCASLHPREVLLPPWGARVPRLGNTGLRVLIVNGNPAAVWSMIIDQLWCHHTSVQHSWPYWSCQLADLEWVCLLYVVISGTHVHVHPYQGAEYTYQIWSPLKINTKLMPKVGKTNSNQSNS